MIGYKGFKNFANIPLLESTGYVIVMVLGYFFFKEKITRRKLLGVAVIMAGIFVYYML
jgi:multidrug transporter EmrE-like cation transporter